MGDKLKVLRDRRAAFLPSFFLLITFKATISGNITDSLRTGNSLIKVLQKYSTKALINITSSDISQNALQQNDPSCEEMIMSRLILDSSVN